MMFPTPRILVVDDDTETVALLREILVKEGYHVETAEGADEALSRTQASPPDVIISDIHMPGLDGLGLLAEIRNRTPDILVILLTAYGSLKTAVDGIKAGAFDYLSKPFIVDEIRLVVRRALEHRHLRHENQALKDQLRERYRFDNLIGSSAGMVNVYKMIARVAQADSTVLIQGESGSGKELVARAIHANSARSNGPFVVVDGGALAETLLESELFGHDRGAFTGAIASKKGLLEKAHQGTCFLDEVADISPVLQGKLLRVIQEREIRRVGSTAPMTVDVRIIAATNRDLTQLIQAGKFREDLYYRLNVVTVPLPPLRERTEDIPLLAQFFVQKYGATREKPVTGISSDAMDILLKHSWPGNVRELEHVIERAVVLAPHAIIGAHDLPDSLQSPAPPSPASFSPPAAPDQQAQGWTTLANLERDYILRVLEASRGDLGDAAQTLGIHRKTLLRKLRHYGAV